MPREPLVSAVLPTWNSRGVVDGVLESLAAQTHQALEILVVDNGSTDGSAEHVYGAAPAVQVLRRPVNTGFAAACNAGIRLARGAYVLITNDDAVFGIHTVARLVDALERDAGLGAAGPKVFRPADGTRAGAGERVLDSTGIELGLARLAPRDRGEGELDRGQYDAAREVLGPSAAAALYRRSALEAVAFEGQYFDESFGSYYEDVDLACRLQRAGWRAGFVPEAHCWHGRRGPSRLARTDRVRAYVNRYAVFLQHARWAEIAPGPLLWEAGRLVRAVLHEPAMAAVLPELARRWPAIRARRRALRAATPR